MSKPSQSAPEQGSGTQSEAVLGIKSNPYQSTMLNLLELPGKETPSVRVGDVTASTIKVTLAGQMGYEICELLSDPLIQFSRMAIRRKTNMLMD